MLWILALVLVMNIDIVGRFAFNRPLTGATEFVAVSVSALVFLLLPQTVHADRTTRVTLFHDLIRKASPLAGRVLDRAYLCLGTAVYGALSWWMAPKMVQAWRRDAFVGAEGIFRFPEWPIFLVICVGAALSAASCLSRLRDRDTPPA